ncbi:uncharacterized protein LOC102616034 isoform X2 [Citrus sinensis]|uniref:uncharacterized protein LOC102616034 isoform X2 n=1 Tax=Citrus sinensis TaxID=2711 RepID=UPI0003D7560A|nr:uncharacterized protein LOC102616034 isoform X2 [Citrus sinensis]XP_024041285.1 uncharacterized protein LOC18043876 isoform X2 [Citrus x clementina]
MKSFNSVGYKMVSFTLRVVKLESLEGGGVLKQPGGIPGQEEANSSAVGEVETEGDNAGQLGGEGAEISREEIINELRHVKRQNFITHCLLSAMIFLTLSWQLSEVKLILKVRDGINHPFKAVGSMLKGMFKRPRDNGRDAEQQQQHEAPQYSPFKMPELPHMDLAELGMNGERH